MNRRFAPPLEIRELRKLTRYRDGLMREGAALANRIQKIAERASVGHNRKCLFKP